MFYNHQTKTRLPDMLLISLICVIASVSLLLLYSASDQSISVLYKQLTRISIGFAIMLICCYIPPHHYKQLATPFYIFTLIMLILVLITGHTGKGAQRWLNLGFIRFEPSEMMKIALPLMLAKYLHDRPIPIKKIDTLICLVIGLLPTLLIIKQPDLGTGVIILLIAISTIFLAGI